MQSHFKKLLNVDIILWSVICATNIAFAIAILLFFWHSYVLEFIVGLQSIKYISAFLNLPDFQKIILTSPKLMSIAALGVAFSGLIYGFCWRYIPPILPSIPSSKPNLKLSFLSISFFEVIFLLILLVVALTIRLHSINRGLYYGEIATVINFVAVDSFWTTISYYEVFNNHIAYSILAYFSRIILGQSEWALRLPALLMGITSLYLFWYLARDLVDRKIAVLASFGLAIAPAHVSWSVSVRGYSGLVLFTLISTFLYFRLLRQPSYRVWILFILASVAGIYTHLYASFVTGVQILLVLFLVLRQTYPKQEKVYLSVQAFRFTWSAFLVIIFLSFLCYLPVLTQLVFWIVARGQGSFQIFFPITLAVLLSGSTGYQAVTALVFMLFVLGLVTLWRSHFLEAVYFTFLAIIPLLIVWLILRPFGIYPRFFGYYLPYYILLVFLGYLKLWDFAIKQPNQLVKYSCGIGCLIFLLFASYVWGTNSWFNIRDDGYLEATNAIVSDATPSIGLCAIGAAPYMFQYYSEKKLFIPKSFEEFTKWADNFNEIKCVYYKERWGSFEHTKIGDFLLKHAESTQIGLFVVFRYKSREQLN